ncbi:MAG: hypothetical protein V1909_01145 [Candidatus Micrarchaeota archaeon]
MNFLRDTHWLAFIGNVVVLLLLFFAGLYSGFDDPSLINSVGYLTLLISILTLFYEAYSTKAVIEKRQYSKLVPILANMAITLLFVWVSTLYINADFKSPEVCTMSAGMTCAKFWLHQETDKTDVLLVNRLQKEIIITNISCTKNPNQFEPCDSVRCKGFDAGIGGVLVPLGASINASITCNDENGNAINFFSGDDFSGKVNAEYYFKEEGANALRKISGNVYARVT